MNKPGTSCLKTSTMGAVAIAWALATVGALALWQKAPPFIDASYGVGHQPFELLGLFLSLIALAVGWSLLPKGERNDAGSVVTVMLWLLPVFAAIHQVSEYATPSWDWKCYVGGAEALIAGTSPYNECYLYPPLVAQVMAGSYPLFAAVGEFLALNSPKHWMVVFIFWHSAQVLMVGLSVYLLHRLARRHGASSLVSAAIVAAVLVVCTPLERTIRHNQVNLIVLNLMMLAMDRATVRAGVSGALVALAAHVKLLPLVLLAPFAMARRLRFVAGIVVGFCVIALAQGVATGTGSLWVEFLGYGPQFVSGEYFRDNSFTGLVFNTVRVPVDLAGGTIKGWQNPLRAIGLAVSLLVSGAVFHRLRASRDPDQLVAVGMATMLLISPIAWEHHYVWALPLGVLCAVRHGRGRPLLVVIASLLVFALPTFDVFPLSYHRLCGLLLLLRVSLAHKEQD